MKLLHENFMDLKIVPGEDLKLRGGELEVFASVD